MKKSTSFAPAAEATVDKTLVHNLYRTADQLATLVEQAKKRYDAMDATTKKRVITGVAGAVAIVGAAVAGKKIMSNSRGTSAKK